MKRITLSVPLFLICAYTNAQQAFNNSGNLQIHTGASITGFGNFTNIASGVLVNNGSFYVKGNLSNDQLSMATGTGTLYLNGSSAQAVNGSQPFRTYHFNTNNSSGITLNNNLSVSGTHTFTSGLIATSATPDYLVYEAGSSYTGNGDTRHVNGWVKKFGSTNFTFPVGDATYERTAAVVNLSAVSEINCHYYTPTSNIFNLAPPLIQVHSNEYWQIDQISGGSGQVTLNWDHSKVPFENVLIANIRVAHYSTGNWRDAGGSASGNVTTTGTITSYTGSSFSSPFTFGFTTIPLPLKIISLTAERRSGTSFIHWVTENEQNADHFDIQRSYDASVYTTIGNAAARNINSQQHYDFEDHSLFRGIAYYRIRSVDRDGKFSYSRVVAVAESGLKANEFVVLNPARNAITVFNKTGKDGLFDYRLFNAGGQQVLKGNVNMSVNGGSVLPLPVQTAAGVYLLVISNETKFFTQKIVVEK